MILRNVEIEGRAGLDVTIKDGLISAIGPRLVSSDEDIEAVEIDGRGGALIPGLIDYHIHLLATAARAQSLVLDDVKSGNELGARIVAALAHLPHGTWLRATGCPRELADGLDSYTLDQFAPHHPVRVQDQSGALWVLNSLGLKWVGQGGWPPGVERDARGQPTGRIWREDVWLRGQIGSTRPDLAPLGAELARYGITHVTDASASTTPDVAALLVKAHRSGALPQHLTLMSRASLPPSTDHSYAVGPLKLLPDERDLPPLEDFIAAIHEARAQKRAVAVHCVTATELALTLAAFETAGARSGDRIEHGSVIPHQAIAAIGALGLTVVTQPGFIAARGDRYLAEVDAGELRDLYRCASLLHAGIPVLGSSDAPYGPLDCWAAMRAAIGREAPSGAVLGAAERVAPKAALNMWLRNDQNRLRSVVVGQPADLCLLKAPLVDVLANPCADMVAATIIAGRLAFTA
jgi:predicted amidohydrolase YtcJ